METTRTDTYPYMGDIGGGDFRRGESHPRASCTDHEVRLAIELVEGGMSTRDVATKFDVKQRCVQRWVAGARRRSAREVTS